MTADLTPEGDALDDILANHGSAALSSLETESGPPESADDDLDDAKTRERQDNQERQEDDQRMEIAGVNDGD